MTFEGHCGKSKGWEVSGFHFPRSGPNKVYQMACYCSIYFQAADSPLWVGCVSDSLLLGSSIHLGSCNMSDEVHLVPAVYGRVVIEVNLSWPRCNIRMLVWRIHLNSYLLYRSSHIPFVNFVETQTFSQLVIYSLIWKTKLFWYSPDDVLYLCVALHLDWKLIPAFVGFKILIYCLTWEETGSFI